MMEPLQKWFISFAALLMGVALAMPAKAASLLITSPAIHEGGRIPAQFTCRGADKSPALTWSGVPQGSKTLALILDDPDAPGGTFTHWIAFNIPATSSGLDEGVPNSAEIPGGGIQGTNSFGRVGYGGPCPPPGPPHHYHFRLLALDGTLRLGSSATSAELKDAMKGHVKASAELLGIFGR